MENNFDWNEIYKYPPKVNIAGFDPEALKEVASDKLDKLFEAWEETKELEFQRNRLVLQKDKSYKRKLTQQVWSFEIEQKKYFLDIWIKYWVEIAGFNIFEKHKKNNVLDIEKARNVSIEDLYQGELRKVGNRLTGKCPFHNSEGNKEKSASFYIFDDNSFHCFSCQAHGSNAIDFLIESKNLDFISALKELNYG